ncbi:MAG: hypothetical protein WBV71_16365 [Roseobacter sp.]
MMAAASHLDLRILVGAGSFTDAAAALRIIEGFPSSLFSGLGGLFIEETDMFTACQMPHQQVVLPSGIRTLAPTVAQIKLLLRADARAFERAVSKTAQTANAGWAFAEDRGDLIATSLRAAKGWDVLLMGYRRVHPKTGKVVVLKDENTSGDTMDTVADRLSDKFSADRVALSVAPLTKTAQSTRCRRFETLDDCLHAIARMNSLVVLLDLDQGPVHSASDLARVIGAARCPVMVFGAQSQATADEILSTAMLSLPVEKGV